MVCGIRALAGCWSWPSLRQETHNLGIRDSGFGGSGLGIRDSGFEGQRARKMGHNRADMKAYFTLAFALLLATGSASAHHSFAAEFDGDKPVTLTGTVTTVEWTNPHIHFSINVKGEKGTVTQWRFEGYPPNMLIRQGWKRDVTLKPGDTITVFAWRARLEPNLAHAREVTLADGRKLAAGPPAGTGGQ